MPLKYKPKFILPFLRSLILVLLVGLIPLFALWNLNVDQIQAKVIIQPLIYTVALDFVILGIWLLISRSFDKATLLSCLTTFLFFSFGHTYNLIEGKMLFGFSLGFVKLFVIYLIVYILGIVKILIIKKVKFFPYSASFIIAGFLFSMNLFPVIFFQINLNKPATNAEEIHPVTQIEGVIHRDIYLIILDAYGRQDILKEVLGYDNAPFISALKDRGFYIPDCAFSNNDSTIAAVSSFLNYDFLQNPVINNNARNYFKQFGYRFVTGHGYSAFNDIVDSDIYLNYLNEDNIKENIAQLKFFSLYLNTTMFRLLTEIYANNPNKYSQLLYWSDINRTLDPNLKEANYWYYQNKYVFDSLERFPLMEGNFLVYAHINAPHGPYVYRSDGSFRYPRDTNDEKILYSDTITYLNRRVLEVIDVLLKDSDLQPIIILQGDHSIHGMTTGFDLHKILSAYYLPGELNTHPYPTITPVNDFRLIIKNYFDPEISLLPDTLYVKFLNAHESVPASCEPSQ